MESKKESPIQEENGGREPMSPTGQYFSSSVLSLSILAILELEIPFDDSLSMPLLKSVFLPISPRFSSILVIDDDGVKHWKKVNVKLENHVNIPSFPEGLSPESNDIYFEEYLSNLAMEQFPQNQPLWEVHIIKYAVSNAAGALVFKFHHALGDGFSLVGTLFSCFQRADDPSLPLTFPSLRTTYQSSHSERSVFNSVPRFLSMLLNTASDFITTLLIKSSVVVDDRTPIRSATEGVELLPITISSITFSLDYIKQIKAKIGGTVNDIIVGTIFYGSRLYMQTKSKSSSNACSTALVLLNTRQFNRYLTLQEIAKGDVESPWGNRFAFLPVSIPKSVDPETEDPLKFISEAKRIINKKKNSLGVYVTGILLEQIRKFKGAEATSRCICTTLKNTTMGITNLIGPVEQIALADHPCNGIYYVVANAPQSLSITMMSYMGKLRMTVVAEKGFIDQQMFITCLEKAFQRIFKAAVN